MRHVKYLTALCLISLLSGCGANASRVPETPQMDAADVSVSITSAQDVSEQPITVLEKKKQQEQDTSGTSQIPDVSSDDLYEVKDRRLENKIAVLTFHNPVNDKLLEDIYISSDALYEAITCADDTRYYKWYPQCIKGSECPDEISKLVEIKLNAVVTDSIVKAFNGDDILSQDSKLLQDIHSMETHRFDDKSQQVLETINKKYPSEYTKICEMVADALPSSQKLYTDEWIRDVTDKQKKFYESKDFLKDVAVYDISGKFYGVYNAGMAKDLMLLADYINTSLEAAVEDIKLDEHKNISLSELKPLTIYRISSLFPGEQFSFTLINDTNKDLVYTVKTASEETTKYTCALSMDGHNTNLETIYDKTAVDVSFSPIPKDQSILDYVSANKVLRLSGIDENVDVKYPETAQYIYNDSPHPVIISAMDADSAFLNPTIYTAEVPKKTAISLDARHADTIRVSAH